MTSTSEIFSIFTKCHSYHSVTVWDSTKKHSWRYPANYSDVYEDWDPLKLEPVFFRVTLWESAAVTNKMWTETDSACSSYIYCSHLAVYHWRSWENNILPKVKILDNNGIVGYRIMQIMHDVRGASASAGKGLRRQRIRSHPPYSNLVSSGK